jgi:hypothetical protein
LELLPLALEGPWLGGPQRARCARGIWTPPLSARRALAHGLPDAEQVASFGLLSEVSIWRGEWDEAARWAEQALRVAAPGTYPWGLALAARMNIVLREGELDAFLDVLRSLLTVEPARDAIVDVAGAINFASLLLSTGGRFGRVEHCLRWLHAIVESIAHREPVARGWMQLGTWPSSRGPARIHGSGSTTPRPPGRAFSRPTTGRTRSSRS